MLKIVTQGRDGKPMVILGLSFENLDRLRTGHPIRLAMGELVPTGDFTLAITAGETLTSIADELRAAGLPIPEVAEPQPGESVFLIGGQS